MNITSEIERNARFRRLADYLAAKSPLGKLPGRKHIDPLELADLLPWVMLLDVIPQSSGEPRCRIRLMGTEVVVIQGSDGTGKFVDEVLNGREGAAVIRGYSEMLRSRAPQYRRGNIPIVGREHVPYERVAFPLASDGHRIDMLILVFANLPS